MREGRLSDGETFKLGHNSFAEYVETPMHHWKRQGLRVTCEKGYGVLLDPTAMRNLHRLIGEWMKWNQ